MFSYYWFVFFVFSVHKLKTPVETFEPPEAYLTNNLPLLIWYTTA